MKSDISVFPFKDQAFGFKSKNSVSLDTGDLKDFLYFFSKSYSFRS